MNIKFIQNAGLGDILFIEPIARNLYLKGHNIFWDVIPLYRDIREYISYINWTHIEDSNCDKIYNFQHLDMRNYNCKIMEAKYQYAQTPLNFWRSFCYNRNISKELNLIKYLCLDVAKPYRLIHNEYATGSLYKISIPENHNIQNVYIRPIERFSLFDWSSIIENASQIHVVSTSSLYLIEKLYLVKNPDLNLYARHNDMDLSEVEYLLSKDWNLRS